MRCLPQLDVFVNNFDHSLMNTIKAGIINTIYIINQKAPVVNSRIKY